MNTPTTPIAAPVDLEGLRANVLRAFEVDLLNDKFQAWLTESKKSPAAYEYNRLAGTLIGDAHKLIAAASAIEPLLREIAALREAMKPFADEASKWAAMWLDGFHPVIDTGHCCEDCGHCNTSSERASFTIGDLRLAASLAPRQSGEG